jgi:cobalt-zinc-cadmium efflux system protein
MHGHGGSSGSRRSLGLALGLTLAFFFVELVGGYLANSLSLIADSWHMLNDAFALGFAVVAAWVAERPNDVRKTYGYYRAEILAAFLNGLLLFVVVAFIGYSAVLRFVSPEAVASGEMLVIAVLGLIVNGLSALILFRTGSESMNVRGAFLHVVSDALGSVAVIVAGLVILFTGWVQADPLFSVLVGLLIFYGAFKLVRESVNVLLEGAPRGIDVGKVEKRIREQEGVVGIHDLHVWCMTPTRICALSCHVVVKANVDRRKLTGDLISMLDTEFGIDHTTIQLEDEGYPKAISEHWR